MRRKLAKKYIDEGYKIKEWKSRKDKFVCDRYKIKNSKLDKLRLYPGEDEELEQPNEGYFEGEGGKEKYIKYLNS